MIYPEDYERKLGFDEVRRSLADRCLSPLGREQVETIRFSTDADEIGRWLSEVREYRRLQAEHDDFPLDHYYDMREAIARLRLAGTHLSEEEAWNLRRSLDTIARMVSFLRGGAQASSADEETDSEAPYPALLRLTDGVQTFPAIVRRIDSVIDKFGNVKDGASMALSDIRWRLKKTEGSISSTLYTILHSAQREGLLPKDAAPTLRDGRLMLPVAPALKRRISGIVHDESATGRTVFIEPTEVVEANNRIRELEAEERREVVRILTVLSDELRPQVRPMLESYTFLGQMDLIRAKALAAAEMQAIEPTLTPKPHLDWIRAVHPLLSRSLAKQGKKVIPLDISLTATEEGKKNLLIISGPNAGGKSVCLKTVGLLQYMLQCGLSIPVGDRSQTGIFENILIDIGDEQSIEDDLSTYSSHLVNMKQMIRHASERTLLLIDEFGGGTEPAIGGAIAEAVLRQFWKRGAFGVITTHYQNLKHFAEDHEGVVNGAMLYDRHEMRPLFQLSIGQPGSSFAIEIARKTGLPEEVIRDASDIVGSDYIMSDRYLQDIVRDKRYWEGKRQVIHQQEKSLESQITRYEDELGEIDRMRRDILRRAKEEAEELLREANRRIENTIREIREAQAEREAAKRAREELEVFREEVAEIDSRPSDEMIEKKMRQIEERRARREKRKKEKAAGGRTAGSQTAGAQTSSAQAEAAAKGPARPTFQVGDTVRIKGLQGVGTIESISGGRAQAVFGGIRTKIQLDRLEAATPQTAAKKSKEEERKEKIAGTYGLVSSTTRTVIDQHREQFRPDLDVRGMRGDEAIDAVLHFIDDAILVGMSRVRILHGTGSGILRQLIRQYLGTIPGVSRYHDEHVQFGGAGITVVDLD